MKIAYLMKTSIKMAVVFFVLTIITYYIQGGLGVIFFVLSLLGLIFMCTILFVMWLIKSLLGSDYFDD